MIGCAMISSAPLKASSVWHMEPRIKNERKKKTKTDMYEITKKQLQSTQLFKWVER